MKKTRLIKRSKKGMTLVELIVAIALISIVFASAMTGIVHGYASVASNKTMEDASMQAQGVADIVTTELNKTTSTNGATSIDDAVNAVMEQVGKDNSFKYFDGISGTVDNFPDSNYDVQVLVEKSSTGISGTDGVTESHRGYKVTVAVPCASSNGSSSFAQVTSNVILSTEVEKEDDEQNGIIDDDTGGIDEENGNYVIQPD